MAVDGFLMGFAKQVETNETNQVDMGVDVLVEGEPIAADIQASQVLGLLGVWKLCPFSEATQIFKQINHLVNMM